MSTMVRPLIVPSMMEVSGCCADHQQVSSASIAQLPIRPVPGEEESPFITPQSPSLMPTHPENIFTRGFRSVCFLTLSTMYAAAWVSDCGS